MISEFVEYYDTIRLHSSIGYIAPLDKLEGREEEIHNERDRKLAEARSSRKNRRENLRKESLTGEGDKRSINKIDEAEASTGGKQLARNRAD